MLINIGLFCLIIAFVFLTIMALIYAIKFKDTATAATAVLFSALAYLMYYIMNLQP